MTRTVRKATGTRQRGTAVRLRNVTSFEKGGRTYYRFRKTGLPTIYLPGEPGSEEFLKVYAAAKEGRVIEPEPVRSVMKQSLRSLAPRYLRSDQITMVTPSTASKRKRNIERLCDARLEGEDGRPAATMVGDVPIPGMRPKHVKRILAHFAPGTANEIRSILIWLLDEAVDEDWLSTNPARAVKRVRYAKRPHREWSEADIEKYEAHWAPGTMERLALYCLLYSGQRVNRAVTMGDKDRVGDKIRTGGDKEGNPVIIPMHPDWLSEIAAHPKRMVYLHSSHGRPFSSPATLGKFVAASARKAGVDRTAHGMRKAAARRLAEAGCTIPEIMSHTGHVTEEMATYYVGQAAREQLAESAMAKVLATTDRR